MTSKKPTKKKRSKKILLGSILVSLYGLDSLLKNSKQVDTNSNKTDKDFNLQQQLFTTSKNDIDFTKFENEIQVNKYYNTIEPNKEYVLYNYDFLSKPDAYLYDFFKYASEGDISSFENYIKNIKNINYKDADGNSYLTNIINYSQAGTSGDYTYISKDDLNKSILLLVNRGVDVNSVNKKGDTALHVSIQKYLSPDTIDLLISKNANLSIKNNRKEDALSTAFTRGKIRLLNHLILRYNKLDSWKDKYGRCLLVKLATTEPSNDYPLDDIIETIKLSISRGAKLRKSYLLNLMNDKDINLSIRKVLSQYYEDIILF